MRASNSRMLLHLRLLLRLQVATALTLVTERILLMVRLLHRILMRTTRPLKNLPQSQPMTRTAPPSQVAIGSLWRRSARNSSKRRRLIKKNLKRTTRTNRGGFRWLIVSFGSVGIEVCVHERNGRYFLTLVMKHGLLST